MDEPYIPEDATIAVTYNQGDSVSVHTSRLTLKPGSGVPDPSQVGTRYEYVSECLDLPGEPVIRLYVIQALQGGCHYIDEDIHLSVVVDGEAPSDWYSFDIQLDHP